VQGHTESARAGRETIRRRMRRRWWWRKKMRRRRRKRRRRRRVYFQTYTAPHPRTLFYCLVCVCRGHTIIGSPSVDCITILENSKSMVCGGESDTRKAWR
jgi:hypothetical protein